MKARISFLRERDGAVFPPDDRCFFASRQAEVSIASPHSIERIGAPMPRCHTAARSRTGAVRYRGGVSRALSPKPHHLGLGGAYHSLV
jgi:hypothetical protein